MYNKKIKDFVGKSIPQLYLEFIVTDINKTFEECGEVKHIGDEWIYEFSDDKVDYIKKKLDEFDKYYEEAVRRMEDLKMVAEVYKEAIENIEEVEEVEEDD